jgi:hypothetical protein
LRLKTGTYLCLKKKSPVHFFCITFIFLFLLFPLSDSMFIQPLSQSSFCNSRLDSQSFWMSDIWEQIGDSHSTRKNLDAITSKKRQNKSYAEKMHSNFLFKRRYVYVLECKNCTRNCSFCSRSAGEKNDKNSHQVN